MCSNDYIFPTIWNTLNHYSEQLDILNFNALVTQRISLIMFKIHTASVPLPISNLFILNNLHHQL